MAKKPTKRKPRVTVVPVVNDNPYEFRVSIALDGDLSYVLHKDDPPQTAGDNALSLTRITN